MKRVLFSVGAVAFGIWVASVGTAFAQGDAQGGFPPPTDLYNDAVLLARALPLVIALAIGFGVWQARASLRQVKSAPNLPYVIRHDLGTVISHWTNALGFILGMVTGLIVLRRLPRPDEIRVVFDIHYIGAALVLFGIATHLTQNAVTGGMGLIPRSLRDVRDALAEAIEYSGVFGPDRAVFGIRLPKFIRDTFGETFASFGLQPTKRLGKFLPVEKILSYTPWAIIVGGIIITGVIKSIRYLYPIPSEFIGQVTFVHDVLAYASVAMLVIHLAAILLVPRNWPLFISMLTTRISRKHVQQWHPLWYKELTLQEQVVASAPPQQQSQPVAAQVEQNSMPKAAK